MGFFKNVTPINSKGMLYVVMPPVNASLHNQPL